MRIFKHFLIFIFILINTVKGFTQNYPIQSFVQINQPFSAYLPDYADPFNNQLKVLLTLTDYTVASYQVKIKITFTGNDYVISTKDNLNLPPITLTPGVPFEISGSNLAPYLTTQNLNFSGIDVNNYVQNKYLRDGPCQICVEVLDYNNINTVQLGNPSCAQAWFAKQHPPLLSSPFCGDTLTAIVPQVVLFNWSPITNNSPTTITTEYVFELYENTSGAEIDPNYLVTSTLPVAIITTPNPFINFGITDYQLQIGKQYVWRVQARTTDGRDLYENNGYSSICTFVYGSFLQSLTDGVVLELQTSGTGTRQGYATWNANSIFDKYVLEVRKTGDPTYEWFQYTTEFGIPMSNMKINNLEPETEYESRIKGVIGDNEFESDYSEISVFTTQPSPNYECGNENIPADPPNIVPLENAIAGMFFNVGQFEMQVTNIEALPEAGHFKGTGKITVAFLFRDLNVAFNDILVDENLKVRTGKVEAITKGIDAWEHDYLIDMAVPHYTPPVDTTQITMQDSTGVLVTFNGIDSTFTFPGGGVPVVLNAEGGIQYIIWPDGSIETGTWGNVSSEEFDATADYYVYFEETNDQKFGFDKFNTNYTKWAANYENILLSDNSPYYVSYKSLGWNEGDYVKAILVSDSAALNLEFTIDGIDIDTNDVNKINATTYIINLTPYNTNNNSKTLYAFDSYNHKIGKLKIIPYAEKTVDLIIVPVNNATINLPNLQDSLNAIYACANTHFNVSIASAFTDQSWDLNQDGKMEITDPELFDLYSDEMKALRSSYFADTSYNKHALYLFVIDEFDSPGTEGYMVHNKALGFITPTASEHTVAHEIGHGAFNLSHTFPEVTKGSTNNLMDYANGNHLTKVQWEKIFSNTLSFSFLDDAEDGEYKTDSCARVPILLDSVVFNFANEICQKDINCYFDNNFHNLIISSNKDSCFVIQGDSVLVTIIIIDTIVGSVVTENRVYRLNKNKTGGAVWLWRLSANSNYNNSQRIYVYDKSCDNRGVDSSYCGITPIIPPPPPIVKDFAVYVAYPYAYARPGKCDTTIAAKKARKWFENGGRSQVGHTGICLVKIDTNNLKAKIDYYDFGRFAGPPSRTDCEGIRRHYELDSVDIYLDNSDNTYKIKNINDINNSINSISYFSNHQSTYSSKEIAVIPIDNYAEAKAKAEDDFYSVREFGFGDSKSFCTDYVHDIILAGGINAINLDGINVIDISSIMKNLTYIGKLLLIMRKHRLKGGTKFNPNIMSYYYSDFDKLSKTPLPISIVIQLRKDYEKFN
jgi:hypothetical protein